MLFPAIAWREMTVKARQEKLLWQRLLAGGAGVGVVVIMLVVAEALRSTRAVGALMFEVMGWSCMVLGMLEGLRQTVDSISAEKREGTLGLLVLANISSLDVVLGKWVVHALSSFYHLLAVLPALAIPFVLGGVTAGELGRLLLAVGNGVFCGLALGMLVSARGRDEGEVWAAGLSWLICWSAGGLLLSFVPGMAGLRTVEELLDTLSPLQPWRLTPAMDYQLAPAMFWKSLAASHLVGWLLLVLAGWSMMQEWKRMVAEPPRRSSHRAGLAEPMIRLLRWLDRRVFQKTLGFGPESAVARFLLNERPPAGLVWTVLLGGAAALAVGAWPGGFLINAALVWCGMAVFYGLHWVLRLWVAAQSARLASRLLQAGWLDTLLGTPLSHHELARALLLSQKPVIRTIFFLLMGMELAGVCLMFLTVPGFRKFPHATVLALWLAGAAVLWADLLALNSAGLWHGLTLARVSTALRRTVTQVLLLPLLAAPLAGVCVPGLLPALMIGKAAALHQYFKNRLLGNFREALEQMENAAEPTLAQWAKEMTGFRRKPPIIAGIGLRCVSCGRGVGNAEVCPFCGYRQPYTQA